MAHHKSAKKRIRRNERRRVRNKQYLAGMRTAVKKFRAAVGEGKQSDLNALFLDAQRMLGRAVTKGLMHANTASRRTSRLAKLLSQAQTGSVPTKAKKKKKATKKKAAAKKKTSKKKTAKKKA